MEPIISPWFVYFAGIVDPLKCALGLVSCVLCWVSGSCYSCTRLFYE